MAADPHSILSAAAARPHTLRGRTQPAKALGSITSGWLPQLARRKALHLSKSNCEVSTKSVHPPIMDSVIGSGPDIADSADAAAHAPFNLLITRSLLLLSINSQADADSSLLASSLFEVFAPIFRHDHICDFEVRKAT